MLENIFLNVLHMGFTASIVILAVFAARFLLRKQPRIFSYVLWIAVLFRLLCPVSFSSIYSVFSVLQEKNFNGPVIEYINPDIFNMPENNHTDISADTVPIKDKSPSEQDLSVGQIILNIAKWIWLAGTAIMSAGGIIKMIRLYIKLKGAVRKEKNIYIAKQADVPFVAGIIKPVIYLPAFLEEKETEYIILHEQAHIKRKDYLFRFLGFIALSIHWFNPLVWLAFFYSGEDMEMSCDESVIRKMGENIKKEYSVSLLRLAAGERIPGSFFVQFGGRGTKKRVENILKYKRKTISAIIIILLLVSGTVFVLISNPKKTEVKEVQSRENPVQNNKVKQIKPDRQKTFKEEMQGGTIYVNIRSIARSAKSIDLFVLLEDNSRWEKELEETDDISLAFADNCIYKVNYEMDKIKYTETDFDTFADLINKDLYGNKFCRLYFTDGLVVEADLINGNYYNGISYSGKSYNQTWHEEVVEKELYKSYIKTEQVQADVSEAEGMETIEIYTDKKGRDASIGMILVKNSQGKILYSENIDTGVAGLAKESINTGTTGGKDFLMDVCMEDKDTYGSYIYHLFRLDENGGILQIAGSEFEFNTEHKAFPEKTFRKWTKKIDYYFKSTRFLIGRQGEKILTGLSGTERNQYHYGTLEDRLK